MRQRPRYRLLIGGPKQSGKSTFAVTLYRHLSNLVTGGRRVSLHELDVHSDTHAPLLGLKPWSARIKRWPLPQEAPHDIIDTTLAAFTADQADIVIGDLPGRLENPYLIRMMRLGTHAIYLGHHFNDHRAWRQAFDAVNVPILWNILSVKDSVPTLRTTDVRKVWIMHLPDRRVDLNVTCVRAFAHVLHTSLLKSA